MSDFFVFKKKLIEEDRKTRIKKFLYKNKNFIVPIIIVALVLPLTLIFSQKEQDTRTRADREVSPLSFKSYNQSVKLGKARSLGKILEIDLSFEKKDDLPEFKILKIRKKNGLAPSPADKDEYSLVLKDESDQLYTFPFNAPIEYTDPPDPDGGDLHKILKLNSTNFSLSVPYLEKAKTIEIIDKSGKVILSSPIRAIEEIDNTPQFYSQGGYDFRRMRGADVETSEMPKEYLDVVFIGDKYKESEMEVFHNDLNKFIETLLSYEPFKTRSSEIVFHYVDNISDLGCEHHETMTRLIVCNNSSVVQAINSAATPYDQIVVIVKDSEYGGSGGGDVSVAYNGEHGALIFVHEFGHSFGNLLDEYILYSDDGSIINIAVENCYAGKPPAKEWIGLVNDSDYHIGCSYPNWNRPSAESMMLTLGPPFNEISQKLLNSKLDYYTSIGFGTPTPSPTPLPESKILNLSPTADAFVRSSSPNKNYGTLDSIQTGLSPNEIGYIKFDLSQLAGKHIKKAMLKLKVSDSTRSTQSLRKISAKAWSENKITYNKRPSVSKIITSFPARRINSFIELDVLSTVEQGKGGNITFALVSKGSDPGSYYSRESSNSPQLIIEYYD